MSGALPKESGTKKRFGIKLLTVLAVLAVLIGIFFWYKFFREVPQQFDSMADRFKYGSIGTEAEEGIPYWIWLVLPRAFPEHLPGPGGYESLGVAWEEGHETPVGFSKKTIGLPRVGINCALCHSGTFRTVGREDQAPTIVPTAPSTTFDAQGYQRFLFACASDPRFTADTLMEEIEYNIKLSWIDKLLYRQIIIPATRKTLLETKDRYSWMGLRPDWGCGRIDPFNPVKFYQLGLDPEQDSTIGNSDMEPIWNMAEHEGYALHWDGLNTSLTEVVLSGAIGDGATAKSLPVDELKDLERWLKSVKPPEFPYGIDRELASRGASIFRKYCAECHAFDGERTGTVIPLEEVGTDPHRLHMWTKQAAENYNAYASEYSWDFNGFQKTDGYVAVPMDGIWLRAPYLHNGSVPTLEDLLKPAEERTQVFYRGYDVYDQKKMGFIHEAPEAESRETFKYDVSVEGNGNMGHEGEEYGTQLPDEDKAALIEYLKTQ